jgi:ubiquinol-cytochrome c reductase cytochrome b subunit
MTTTTGPGAPAPAAPARRPGAARRFLDAVDERLGIGAIQYPVPEHANNLTWSLGGLTAVSFLILLVTGIVLAQFYDPIPEVANDSVRSIVHDVVLGRYLRSLHFWAAQAMYVLAALHLLRVYFTASYKRPREGNWLIGVAMFALVIGALFTGTVLKWDQEGYEALGHNLETAKLLGGAGFWFSADLAGKVPLLLRVYVAHIVIIPVLILFLVVLHALLVKRHKISPFPPLADAALLAPTQPAAASADDATDPAESSETAQTPDETAPGAPGPAGPDEAGEPSAPFIHHLRRISTFGLVLLGVLTVLAVVFPPGLGPTPVAGIEVTKPPWEFWWTFMLENLFGLSAILWSAVALFVLLVAVPFIDRNPKRWWRHRPVATGAAAVVLAALVVLSILTTVTTAAEHL